MKEETISTKEWNLKQIICNYTPQIALFIPVTGFILRGILNIISFLKASGYYGYYGITKENMIFNNMINIYDCIIMGIIALFYCSYCILAVRRILSRKINILYWGVFSNYIVLLFICVVILKELSFASFIASFFLLPIQGVLTYAIGYCLAYPMQSDFIEKNKKNKIKKSNTKRKSANKNAWGDREYMIMGIIIFTGALLMGIFFTYKQGYDAAKSQKKYGVININSETYAVIGTNENIIIAQKCEYDEKSLKIYNDTYVNINKQDKLIEYHIFESVKLNNR